MERDFTTASQMICDMQKILMDSPTATASMEKLPERLRIKFTCGDVSWNVKLIQMQGSSGDDRSFFSNMAAFFAALNSRMCIRNLGFQDCTCGKNNFCIVTEVHVS